MCPACMFQLAHLPFASPPLLLLLPDFLKYTFMPV